MTERLEIVISGQVQGAFFRSAVQEQAQRLGVAGWIRPHGDGTVRVLAEGPRSELSALLQFCHEQGVVARAEPTWGEATGEFVVFDAE
jgi:acylphosphatase